MHNRKYYPHYFVKYFASAAAAVTKWIVIAYGLEAVLIYSTLSEEEEFLKVFNFFFVVVVVFLFIFFFFGECDDV